ncbi:MAG: hypothetical protein NZ736_06280 [Candidatus Poseidoniaceae archaeon]|nr:hypothetical protein [Candidatus Poseidoniaceae archaeon]
MAAKFNCALLVVLLLLMPFTAIDNSLKTLDEPIVVNNATMDSYNHSVFEQEVITLESGKILDHLRLSNNEGVLIGVLDNLQGGNNIHSFGAINVTLTSTSIYMFVAKYDSNLSFVWVKIASYSKAFDVAEDSSGNLIVSGTLTGNSLFGTTVLTRAGNTDLFITSISSTGQWNWATKVSPSSSSQSVHASDLEVDLQNNLLFVSGTGFANNIGTTTICSSYCDFIISLNTSNGLLVNHTSFNHGVILNLDLGPNSTIVASSARNSNSGPSGTIGSLSIPGDAAFVVGFSQNLTALWYQTTSSLTIINDIEHDSYGNLYVVGEDSTTLGSFSRSIGQSGFVGRINASSHQWDWVEWPGHRSDLGYNYSYSLSSISISQNGNIGVIGEVSASTTGVEYTFGNLSSRTYYVESGVYRAPFFGLMDQNHTWLHVDGIEYIGGGDDGIDQQDSISNGRSKDSSLILDGTIPWLAKSSSLTMLNIDYDRDGIFAPFDNCPNGLSEIGYDFDFDKDGCHDVLEDLDDDGDGIDDSNDSCNFGITNWVSNNNTDRDSDGCRDNVAFSFSEETIATDFASTGGADDAYSACYSSTGGDCSIFISNFRAIPSGGAFVAGTYMGSIELGNITLNSTCGVNPNNNYCSYREALFVAKIDASGKWIWAVNASSTWGQNGYNAVNAIEIDQFGDAYITGIIRTQGYSYNEINFGNILLDDPAGVSGNRAFIAKVNQSGYFDWALMDNKTSAINSIGYDLIVDSGMVTVIGSMTGIILDWDSETSTQTKGFVAQLTSNTGTVMWISKFSTSATPDWDSVHIETDGQDVFIATSGRVSSYDGYSSTTPSEGLHVTKINNAGSWQWVKGISQPYIQNPHSIGNFNPNSITTLVLDGNGGYWVAGSARYHQTATHTIGTICGNQNGQYCGYVQHYDSTGTRTWSHIFPSGTEIFSMINSSNGLQIAGSVNNDIAINGTLIDYENTAFFIGTLSQSNFLSNITIVEGELFEPVYPARNWPYRNLDVKIQQNSTGNLWVLGTYSSNYVSINQNSIYESHDDLRSMIFFESDEEDYDDDGDGILDIYDNCTVDFGWVSNSMTDHDSDGCQDSGEDLDDDNDGISDDTDNCSKGEIGWLPDSDSDYDADGCMDDSEDFDDDNDGISDALDLCQLGNKGWVSGIVNDHDGDGCEDISEDLDDDNDSVLDSFDSCEKGELGWMSNLTTDYDGDGCKDGTGEELDDDNDGVSNLQDNCPRGELNWQSSIMTDSDGDGCRDSSEDFDRDNDEIVDSLDLCPDGENGWISSSSNDMDGDGCRDSTEDDDDDGDGVSDLQDSCPAGLVGWTSNLATDYDLDGCEDSSEDVDDDSDGILDVGDLCQVGTKGWTSNSANDHDSDGCVDASEDDDDDNDGVVDFNDYCPKGSLNWQSNQNTDKDGDGCRDQSEDLDDDNDGLSDGDDLCDKGEIGWNSGTFTDYDGDGCKDSSEDLDDDNDGVIDDSDLCPTGILDWTSKESVDYDSDGCNDNNEDSDDDNDGLLDTNEICPKGSTGWVSNLTTDYDGDGCNDLSEDADDDNDAILDVDDSCQLGKTEWTSNPQLDLDGDGCFDATEDGDDDNDGVEDNADTCPRGETGWISDSVTDVDSDGCKDDSEDSSIDLSSNSNIKNDDGSINLDAIGLLLAILFPTIGAIVTIVLRNKQKLLLRNLMDSLANETTVEGLEQVFGEIRNEFADENISPAHFQRLLMEYDMIKSRIDSDLLLSENSFDQTHMVLESEKEIPSLPIEETVNTTPAANIVATQIDDNGYEWVIHDNKNWYRTAGSQAEWIEFQN